MGAISSMIEVRACRGLDELQACVDLQVEVWGYCDGDVIPRRVFLVARKIGGQVIGAFERAESEQGSAAGEANLVGFALSLPGVKTAEGARPEGYLHSHMLGVKEGYRDRGLGARLKLAQREEALTRGIRRIEWTFDPLEIKNAFLNIHKLGAVVRRYEEDFYGVSSSRLQGGLPTDRLVAEWWLDSARVVAAVSGEAGKQAWGRAGDRSGERAGELIEGPGGSEVLDEIRVPAAIYEWKANEEQRSLALGVQCRNRVRFQEAFSKGLAVIGFTRDANGDGVFRLGRWLEPAG